jgi:hypothetical protein
MNRTIKQFAIENKICHPAALEDPEGSDGYVYYDSLTRFVEQTKQYYTNRAVQQCLDLCANANTGAEAAQLIQQQFGIKQ